MKEKTEGVFQSDGGGQEKMAGEEGGREGEEKYLLPSLDVGTVEQSPPHLHCGTRGERESDTRPNLKGDRLTLLLKTQVPITVPTAVENAPYTSV